MHALKALEFQLVLEQLAEACESPLGADLARVLEPSFDLKIADLRRRETAEALTLLESERLPSLGSIRDLRQPAVRAARGGTLDALSIYQLGEALGCFRAIKSMVRGKEERLPLLTGRVSAWVEDARTEEVILRSVDSGGEVLDAASLELAKLRRQKRNAAQRLTEKIQSYTTGSTRDYLSDPIVTQRGGRYVIPVKAEHKSKVRGIVHDTSGSGQTLFVEPAEVIEIGNSLRQAEAAEQAEVARILQNLSSRLGALGIRLSDSLEEAAELDLVLAKARLGLAQDGCLAESAPAASIKIEFGRHPLLDPKKAVPLSLDLHERLDGILITGPNTGGKTVALKTVGLYVLMTQCGMMLPAQRAWVGHFSQVWADIGDEQSLQQSLSTFSAHVKNIAEALNHLKSGALLVFDEIGAGTDPAEGAALARSILLETQSRGAKVMASTHYGELKLFAANTPGFTNCAMEFDPKSLRPTYKLLMDTPGSSHALKIAERCGMPKQVVARAQEDQGVAEQDIAQMLDQLEHAQRRAMKAQSEADRLTHRLREVEAQAEKKLREAEEIRRTVRQRVADEVDEQMRQLRLEASDLFEQLKKAGVKSLDAAREKLKQLDAEGRALADRTRPEREAQGPAPLTKGMPVKVRGYNQVGTVLDEPSGGKVRVQVGALKMTLSVTDLEPQQSAPKPKAKARPSQQLAKAQTARVELDLRGERVEEAQLKLERFLDDSILAGWEAVRIVHGKGEGVLRQLTRDILRKHKGVGEFRDGDANEGGQGVTIAALR